MARTTSLHAPTHRETLWALEEAFDGGDMVTLFGRCTVEYDGRASSSLGPGDRLLILKPDGAALVHTDEKRTPVNWQPPGSEHRASVRDGQLNVRSSRTNPDEVLDVRFEAVHQFSALPVTGHRELSVRGSEEDLRRRILDDPDLVEAGFTPLETERETDAGAVDVYGEDGDGTPVAVELKRRRVGPSAAGQLQRYVEALEREFGDGVPVRGLLVAPSITDRTADLLDRNGLGFVPLGPEGGSAVSGGTDRTLAEFERGADSGSESATDDGSGSATDGESAPAAESESDTDDGSAPASDDESAPAVESDS